MAFNGFTNCDTFYSKTENLYFDNKDFNKAKHKLLFLFSAVTHVNNCRYYD